jgi:hypothetical protein
LMRHYLYLVNGWPTIATDETRRRRVADTLVGVYEDDQALMRRFGELIQEAQHDVARGQ